MAKTCWQTTTPTTQRCQGAALRAEDFRPCPVEESLYQELKSLQDGRKE